MAYLPLLYFIITHFILYFIVTFPLIVFIKSVNKKNINRSCFGINESIRRKTSCTFIQHKYANSLTNIWINFKKSLEYQCLSRYYSAWTGWSHLVSNFSQIFSFFLGNGTCAEKSCLGFKKKRIFVWKKPVPQVLTVTQQIPAKWGPASRFVDEAHSKPL